MIALPVLGVTAVDVLARTTELSPAQQASRDLGQADAAYSDTGLISIEQSAGLGYSSTGRQRQGPAPDPAGFAPAGSRTLLDRIGQGTLTAGDRTVQVAERELAYDDPLARGLYNRAVGHAPRQPGEVTLTRALADRLRVGLGDTVRREDPASIPLTVVGLVDDASRDDALVALLAVGTPRPAGLHAESEVRVLVRLPRPLTWDDVRVANRAGVLVRPRAAVPGAPPASDDTRRRARTVATVLLVAGMALLEVVLLAGPAFAVGAKRQRHQLALLAATGADRPDVRRTVLAGGLVLGGLGGLVGVVGGVGLAAAALPVLGGINHLVPGPFDVRPVELASIGLLGVGTAVLAALLPARAAARQDVVAALTGRRGAVRSSRRTPLLGLVATAAGAALALYGAARHDALLILAGSAVAELGLVATTPVVVGLVGRLGPLLPVAPRLALRDAARNRGRTAPAVSAVLAAVAGSVAVATYVASLDAHDRRQYVPAALSGTVTVPAYAAADRAQLPAVERELARTLPVRQLLRVRTAAQALIEVVIPADRRCPASAKPSPGRDVTLPTDPRCQPVARNGSQFGGELVGGPDLLAAVTGVRDEALSLVLAAGGVIVPEDAVEHGMVTVRAHQQDEVAGSAGVTFRLPGARLPGSATLFTAVYSPQAAARLGLSVADAGVLATVTRMPSAGEEDRARSAVAALGITSPLSVERGYTDRYATGLLALVLGSAVLVLGASGIATGLAAADGRADLGTLAAVGATPVLRRSLAAFQSALTAGLGTVLGIVAGLVPAVALLRALHSGYESYPVVLPWLDLGVTALVVPALAALAAAVLTRSRLPLVRRLA